MEDYPYVGKLILNNGTSYPVEVLLPGYRSGKLVDPRGVFTLLTDIPIATDDKIQIDVINIFRAELKVDDVSDGFPGERSHAQFTLQEPIRWKVS